MRIIAIAYSIACFAALLHSGAETFKGTFQPRGFQDIYVPVTITSTRVPEVRADQLQRLLPSMVLYIGPDLLLPFTSAIAAAIGVLLMFWQRLVGWARSLWRVMFRRRE